MEAKRYGVTSCADAGRNGLVLLWVYHRQSIRQCDYNIYTLKKRQMGKIEFTLSINAARQLQASTSSLGGAVQCSNSDTTETTVKVSVETQVYNWSAQKKKWE